MTGPAADNPFRGYVVLSHSGSVAASCGAIAELTIGMSTELSRAHNARNRADGGVGPVARIA